MAEEALSYVKQLGLQSDSKIALEYYKAKQQGQARKAQQLKSHFESIHKKRQRFIGLTTHLSSHSFRYLDASKKLKYGNCGECVLHAAYFLQYRQGISNFAILQIPHNPRPDLTMEDNIFLPEEMDHELILLNPSPDAIWGRPETWGADALVLDPWLNFFINGG